MIEYHPFSAQDQSRLHHVGRKVLPAIFLGHASKTWRIWKGDVLVADIEMEKQPNCVEEIMESENPLQRRINL